MIFLSVDTYRACKSESDDTSPAKAEVALELMLRANRVNDSFKFTLLAFVNPGSTTEGGGPGDITTDVLAISAKAASMPERRELLSLGCSLLETAGKSKALVTRKLIRLQDEGKISGSDVPFEWGRTLHLVLQAIAIDPKAPCRAELGDEVYKLDQFR